MGTFYTPREIAEILHVSYETALSVIKYSGISYILIGRQYRVAKKDFESFFGNSKTRVIDIGERYY